MKLPSRRIVLLLVAVAAIVLGCAAVVIYRARQAISSAEQAVLASRDLRYTLRPWTPAINAGFEPVGAPQVFTQAAIFQGHLYVAGPAGLFEFDERGRTLRQFHAGLELPPSPIVAMAQGVMSDSRTPELILATADAGILFFNGNSFRHLLPASPEARAATALLPLASGHLLIGTAKLGVLIYDGQRLGPFHPSLAQLNVTALAGSETDLWVGTQEHGATHFHGGGAEWFTEANGLPDPHVASLAVAGDEAYAGTADGIAQFRGGQFARVLASGAFVRALLPQPDALLAGTMDDGLLRIPLKNSPRPAPQHDAVAEFPEVQQIFRADATLVAVAANGVYTRAAAGEWKRLIDPVQATLSDRDVSALAFDAAGRLWVGYFDRGLDLLDAALARTRHVEDDHVFCVNRILPGAQKGSTAVATANGLVMFDAAGNRKQVLTRSDGLIADHVTDIAAYGDGLALATPAGVTLLDSAGARSLYAFHGLVNNHVYTLSARGPRLLVGTLGGLSLLQNEQVRASYTTANSGLKHNWITASAADGDGFWVGTYGAGVLSMDSAGHFSGAYGAGAGIIINPNALLATPGYVAAGSMGHGLLIYDRRCARWVSITGGLPSLNVTALAVHDGYLYAGTDNGLVRIQEQRLEQ